MRSFFAFLVALSCLSTTAAAFARSDIELAAFHYVRLSADIANFLDDPARQRATDRSWDRLSALLCAEFKRWCPR